LKLLIFILLFVNLYADNDYSLRVAYGKVTSSDFGEVLSGDIKSHPDDLSVLSLDGGYLLNKDTFDLPLDIYLKAGFSNFMEDGHQDDVYETVLYIKLYYNVDFLKNRVRIGLVRVFHIQIKY